MFFVFNIAYVIVMLAILFILLANIEMYISKNNCDLEIELPEIHTIIPPERLGTKYPIYVYNRSHAKAQEMKFLPNHVTDKYEKYEIPIHVATKITQPIKDMFSAICSLPYSRLPINTLYKGLNKSDELLNNINPLNSTDKSKYRLLVSNFDLNSFEVFMDDKIYFIKNK